MILSIGSFKINAMKIECPVFKNEESIPSKYTCRHEDINPELLISEVPENSNSLALIIDDPDAPGGTWVHWLLWNIDPQTTSIAENSVPQNAIQGKNSWNRPQYNGPCPPSGTHRYFFKLFALDQQLPLSSDAGIHDLLKEMKDHIIAECILMGTYNNG